MTKFIKSVAAAAVLATSATGAQAASLSTDVDVNLPEIIALYCYDEVLVNVSAAGLETALGAGTAGGLGASADVTDLTAQDLGATASAGTTTTSVDLNLNNVCAFRALVTNGVDIAVSQSATATDNRIVHDTVTGAYIDANNAVLTTAASVSTGLGLSATPQAISVRVPLDLANASAPGLYESTDLFTITVTAN